MANTHWLLAVVLFLLITPVQGHGDRADGLTMPADKWKFALLYADCVFIGHVTDDTYESRTPEEITAEGRQLQFPVVRLSRFSSVTVHVEDVLRGRVPVDQDVRIWVFLNEETRYDCKVGERRLFLAMEDPGLEDGSYFLYSVFLETKDGWRHAGSTVGHSIEEMTEIVNSMSVERLGRVAELIVVAEAIGIPEANQQTEVVEFRITETHKGSTHSGRIRVRIPRNDRTPSRGWGKRVPSANVGESYYLFLAERNGEYVPVGGPHGFLRIVDGDLVYERRSRMAITKARLGEVIREMNRTYSTQDLSNPR